MNKEDGKVLSGDEVIIDIDSSQLKSVSEEELKKYLEGKPDIPKNENDKQELMDKSAFLWQYKPVNDEEPEPFEEYISSHYINGDIRITGARVRGKKHKHDGTNCDDWFEYDTAGEWTIAAVSDGAGSKKFSRIGAMVSCKAAIAHMKEELEKVDNEIVQKLSLPISDPEFMSGCGCFASIIQDAVIKAYDAVKDAFEDRKTKYEYLKVIDRDMEFKDFSGTLLLSAVIPVMVSEKKEYFVVACQIGDGMICSVDRNQPFDKALRLLGEADSGAYSGETDFLTSESMRKKENLMGKTKIMRGASSAVILMTDGVADDYFPNSPQLLRLVLDLELNGVLSIPATDKSCEEEIRCKIPEPICYPWVNDNEKMIAVQYASRISDCTGCTIAQMWDDPSLISESSLCNFEDELPESEEELLLRWLDNYVERGSFDDRTLLILSVDGK
ncbi:MAG: protein phosphatase 2C domain-containing protein [Oscillospiraceae bacterium]|nr:protein phosphatase 2C domain-containing protein [Oscillospiraceae bacterium]